MTYLAMASTSIHAPISKVWEALTKPEIIKQYMFGTDVIADWKIGGGITWSGEWEGKKYEDRGTILRFEENRVLQYSHFSPMSGKPDVPENRHTVTVMLSGEGNATDVMLTQDNNASQEERARSEKNWSAMLAGLKELLEA